MGSLKVFFSMADASLVLNIDVSICHQDVQTPEPETVQTAVRKRLRSLQYISPRSFAHTHWVGMKEDQPMVIKLSFWSRVLNIQCSYEREVGAGRQHLRNSGTLYCWSKAHFIKCSSELPWPLSFYLLFMPWGGRSLSSLPCLLNVRIQQSEFWLWYPWLAIFLKWTLWMCMRQSGRGMVGGGGAEGGRGGGRGVVKDEIKQQWSFWLLVWVTPSRTLSFKEREMSTDLGSKAVSSVLDIVWFQFWQDFKAEGQVGKLGSLSLELIGMIRIRTYRTVVVLKLHVRRPYFI